MKFLTNNFDKEVSIESVEKAKRYYEIEGEKEYTEDLESTETLEEVAKVLNRYTDILGNGSEFSVKEI